MSKPAKVTKKGFDPPGSSYIALGKKDTPQPTAIATTALTSTTIGSSSSNNSPISSSNASAVKQTSSSSNLVVDSISKTPKLNQSNSSGQIATSANLSLGGTNNGSSGGLLDPLTVKEEAMKLLEKDDTNDKLAKLVKSIVLSMGSSITSSLNLMASMTGQSSRQQTIQQQLSQNQQNEMCYLVALGIIAQLRPSLFIKQSSLTEFVCTTLLFTSKFPGVGQTSEKPNTSSISTMSSVLKSKNISSGLTTNQPVSQQQQRSASPPNSSVNIFVPLCNILNTLYNSESVWPDVFVRAYVDDSLTERAWVDNSDCKEFVENIQTAFGTRPLPFSADAQSQQATTNNLLKMNEDSSDQMDVAGFRRGSQQIVQSRYVGLHAEIETLVVDLIKNFMINGGKLRPMKRPIVPTSGLGSVASQSSHMDNRSFIKLLQHTCGFASVRTMALGKIESWLPNPKLDMYTQDLLLSICVNCTQGDQADKEIIALILKLKPKLKQNQHYYDCIRELIKSSAVNFESVVQMTIRNEISTQHGMPASTQPSSQTVPKSMQNLNILQTAFACDGANASRIMAQTMQKVLIQRHADEYLRSLRILLRDTVRTSRQESPFDLIRFANELLNDHQLRSYFSSPLGSQAAMTAMSNLAQELATTGLFSLAGGLADFNQKSVKERYINNVCDLITVCILVSITPQIKEAYLRRQSETKELLIKYDMTAAQVQCNTVAWLQGSVRHYDVTPNEIVRCICKILFMLDKPEQYAIDNWPPEQERATLFRVVSEIPVLYDTLYQVLLLSSILPENMHHFLLVVEENLLKTAALVHAKDIYSLQLDSDKIEQFVTVLFNLCLYKFQVPSKFTITVLYWKACQVLVNLSALDPKGVGKHMWEKYPTIRLLMEMLITDDYNFPPQSSITENMSVEKYAENEARILVNEKREILELENSFEAMQNNPVVRTEADSKLIGQIMIFDPTSHARLPPSDFISKLKALNTDYKLGQLLCKNRNPDFLLMLIKSQNSRLSLPWLSALIEANFDDAIDIMPIQCVCEYVWDVSVNMNSGDEEMLPDSKKIGLDKLMKRLRFILTTNDLNDSTTIQQIKNTFDYFLNKLCSSDKMTVRNSALKMLGKIFIANYSLERSFLFTSLWANNSCNQQQQQQIQYAKDLVTLIKVFKQLPAFDIYIKPLLIKYFRQAILVETCTTNLNLYIKFLVKQLLIDFKQQSELEANLMMEMEQAPSPTSPSIGGHQFSRNYELLLKNSSFKESYNEVALDLASFFLDRDFYIQHILPLFKESSKRHSSHHTKRKINEIRNNLTELSLLLIKINQCIDKERVEFLLQTKAKFDRSDTESNSYLLIEFHQPREQSNGLNLSPSASHSSKSYIYIHERIFNLIVYFAMLILRLDNLESYSDQNGMDMETENGVDEDEESSDTDELNSSNCHDFLLNLDQDGRESYMNLLNEIVSSSSAFLNCDNGLVDALNELNKDKLYQLDLNAQNIMLDDDTKNTEPISQSSLCFHLLNSLLDTLPSKKSLLDLFVNKYGLSFPATHLIIKKLEADSTGPELSQMTSSLGIRTNFLISLVESYKKQLSSVSSSHSLAVGDSLLSVLKKRQENIRHASSYTEKVSLFENKPIKRKSTRILPKSSLSSEIENSKREMKEELAKESTSRRFYPEKIEIDDVNDTETSFKSKKNALVSLIDSTTSQSLEASLNEHLSQLTSNQVRVDLLAESIVNYESDEAKRSVVNILLDHYCHIDPQIVNNQNFKTQFRLLFELRLIDGRVAPLSSTTHSFLLSLFTHQAGWTKLYKCALYLLKDHTLFSLHNDSFNLNPVIILNFLSSLVHIPELWKGTESKVLQKYDEESILNLNEKQLYCLIDYIIEEMFFRFDGGSLIDLHSHVSKRVQLLKHFLKSSRIDKETVFSGIVSHLKHTQRRELIRQLSGHQGLSNAFIEKLAGQNQMEPLLDQIQNLFLYCVYLEEDRLVYSIINSSRIFSDFYNKIDSPTRLDSLIHDLLNCFGEIEVNFSNNLTSSGIIGVAATASSIRKQEKSSDLLVHAKKQETFMTDANLVCVKLAAIHPLIFMRQLPMMEGLLQGRVAYSFDEFKRRKFDKLFFYVIDLLNSLAPFVFRSAADADLIELIVAHYFDVFAHYHTEGKEFVAGLLAKMAEFLERLVHNSDLKTGFAMISKKSQLIDHLNKLFPDISYLKYLSSVEPVLCSTADTQSSDVNNNETSSKKLDEDNNNKYSQRPINVLNQKTGGANSIWTSKQLEPFIKKITSRESFDTVYGELQDLDTVSQRQSTILSHFVFYLQPLMSDSHDAIRDLAISLIMRYLRLNPKEATLFYQAYSECLTSEDVRVFTSAMKCFADFTLLCSEKSGSLIKSALRGSAIHSYDGAKQLSDAIRLLQLEKYVY